MMTSLYTAATGMGAQKLNIDVIANNLANVNTAGFRRSRADFQDLMYHTIKQAGTLSSDGTIMPTGIQVGLGVRPVAIQKIFEQGHFSHTENPLDIVIEGDGFFQINKPDGEIAYTRSGAFKLDADGRIVNTGDGYPIEPSISIPADATSITISADGQISVTQSGSSVSTVVGQITLARFVNPAGLKAIGKTMFVETDASGAPITSNPGIDGMGTIGQGFLEMSNVNVVEEMVNMIISQRAYEINSKAITASDEMLRTVSGMVR
ncbi:MAG: flagellar basal-body rod protein FlgG [Syntrophorhabdaceae bacterium]|nr:flagellar basal-body rod protein FlgG [Syntrophorhabdaceae bacterium]